MKNIRYEKIKAYVGRILLFAMPLTALASFFYDLVPQSTSFYLALFGGALGGSYIVTILLKQHQFGKVSKESAIALILFLFITISIIFQNILLIDVLDYFDRSALHYTFTIYVVSCASFLFGVFLCNIKIRENNFISLLIVIFIIIGIYANLDGGWVLNYGSLSSQRDGSTELNHLIIGEAAILCIILSVTSSSSKIRILIYFLGLIILFSLGGRVALFCFILTVVCFVFLRNKIKYGISFLILVSILGLALATYFNQTVNDPLVARMLLSSGLNDDSSKLERDEIFSNALPSLAKQALIGDPTQIVKQFGSIGSYSHNLLSAWQFYGFIPFITLLFTIFYIGLFIMRNNSSLMTKTDDFGIFLFIYCVISVATGKAIMFNLFWLALGFWLYRIKTIKKSRQLFG